MANFGQETNWFNSEPSPIQTDVSLNYGNEARWFNSEPSPIQYHADRNASYFIFESGEPDTIQLYVSGVKVASWAI